MKREYRLYFVLMIMRSLSVGVHTNVFQITETIGGKDNFTQPQERESRSAASRRCHRRSGVNFEAI